MEATVSVVEPHLAGKKRRLPETTKKKESRLKLPVPPRTMSALQHEKVWVDKKLYDDAERKFYESQSKPLYPGSSVVQSPAPIPIVPSPVFENPQKIPSNPSRKSKQKNMPPMQNNATNLQTSPKKSKKNKRDKRSNAGKAASVDREKEVSVEKYPVPNYVLVEKEPAAQVISDVCLAKQDKQAKNKDNTEKKAKIVKPTEELIDNKLKDLLVPKGGATQPSGQSLASEVAKARQHIKNSLECMDSVVALAGVPNVELINKINSLEKENTDLKKVVEDLRKLVLGVQQRVESLEKSKPGAAPTSAPAKPAPATAVKDDSDDGVDLFGSDDEEETAEAARVREERLAAYNAKKSKKPVLIAKSNIILDVKPWDDETDMVAMEAAVRGVNTDGLLWGAAKLVPLAYGIHKLQISCVVEDDKVSIDWLQEELEKIEDFVQSVDIAAFNKV